MIHCSDCSKIKDESNIKLNVFYNYFKNNNDFLEKGKLVSSKSVLLCIRTKPPLCTSTAITDARQHYSQMLLTDAVLKDAAVLQPSKMLA
jgi:hypothetical protein